MAKIYWSGEKLPNLFTLDVPYDVGILHEVNLGRHV